MVQDFHRPADKCAATWQNQQNECAPSEDSDQPGLRCPHEESLGP